MVEKNCLHGLEDEWSEDFDNREDLYRKRRDAFRNNEIAMCELAHWKAHDNKIEYKYLYVSISLSNSNSLFGCCIKKSGRIN